MPESILNAGLNAPLPADSLARLRKVNGFAFILGLICIFYGSLFIYLGVTWIGLSMLTILPAAFWASILFNRLGHPCTARFSLFLVFNSVITTYSLLLGEKAGVHYWYLTAAHLPFALYEFKNRSRIFTWVAASVLLLLGMKVFLFGLRSFQVEELDFTATQSINFVMLFLSIASSLAIVCLTASGYEKALKQSMEARLLLKHHIEALNAAAIVTFTDVRGRITHANDAFCEISGFQRYEILGKAHSIINSGFHPPSYFKEMWDTILAKRVWRGEMCNRAKSGALYWVASTIVPILGPNGEVVQFVSIRQDITPQKAREQTMIQSAKMASLGEMAGGIAHEINNPLAVIQGKANLILKKIKAGGFTPEYGIEQLEKLIATSERIAKIVNGLRTFSRSGEKEPFTSSELRKIVSDTQDLCLEKFRNHGVRLDLGHLPDIHLSCRPVQISQVLLNLLNNSFDAIASQPEKWVQIETETSGNLLRILVTDSGNGIPKEVADKIMQPFFTTKEVGKGTGLGLSISRGIIEEHGGRLYVDSSCAHTRFVIELPIARAAAQTA